MNEIHRPSTYQPEQRNRGRRLARTGVAVAALGVAGGLLAACSNNADEATLNGQQVKEFVDDINALRGLNTNPDMLQSGQYGTSVLHVVVPAQNLSGGASGATGTFEGIVTYGSNGEVMRTEFKTVEHTAATGNTPGALKIQEDFIVVEDGPGTGKYTIEELDVVDQNTQHVAGSGAVLLGRADQLMQVAHQPTDRMFFVSNP